MAVAKTLDGIRNSLTAEGRIGRGWLAPQLTKTTVEWMLNTYKLPYILDYDGRTGKNELVTRQGYCVARGTTRQIVTYLWERLDKHGIV